LPLHRAQFFKRVYIRFMEEKQPIGLKKVQQSAVISLQQGKIPPQALELEEAVLGAMLIDKRA